MGAGTGGDAEEVVEKGVGREDRVFDVYGVTGAIVPVGEVRGGVGFVESVFERGGEEVVPVGEAGWKPAVGGVLQELFEGNGLLGPVVEGEDVLRRGFLVQGFVVGGDFGEQEHGPDFGARGGDDGRCGGVDGDFAVPGAEDVGRLVETLGVVRESGG